jgi:hypothetical protein
MDERREGRGREGPMASGPQLVQPGTVHSSTFRLSLRLGGAWEMVGRRSTGGRREACESLRGNCWRDDALCELWVLSRR